MSNRKKKKKDEQEEQQKQQQQSPEHQQQNQQQEQAINQTTKRKPTTISPPEIQPPSKIANPNMEQMKERTKNYQMILSIIAQSPLTAVIQTQRNLIPMTNRMLLRNYPLMLATVKSQIQVNPDEDEATDYQLSNLIL